MNVCVCMYVEGMNLSECIFNNNECVCMWGGEGVK